MFRVVGCFNLHTARDELHRDPPCWGEQQSELLYRKTFLKSLIHCHAERKSFCGFCCCLVAEGDSLNSHLLCWDTTSILQTSWVWLEQVLAGLHSAATSRYRLNSQGTDLCIFAPCLLKSDVLSFQTFLWSSAEVKVRPVRPEGAWSLCLPLKKNPNTKLFRLETPQKVRT